MSTLRDQRKLQSRQAIMEAGLTLRSEKRTFSSVSLREVAREAGLVPTAFYRHFNDMDELGVALVEMTTATLHALIPQIKEEFKLIPNESKAQLSLNVFFRSVHANRKAWDFMIGERWGGSRVINQALNKELDRFKAELVPLLKNLADFNSMDEQDLFVFADILQNLFFSWGMLWLNHLTEPDEDKQLERRLQLLNHVGSQVKLLFRGVRGTA